ncbi:MAG: hypothetical protein AAF611_06140 [Bacteroidota bacterium]
MLNIEEVVSLIEKVYLSIGIKLKIHESSLLYMEKNPDHLNEILDSIIEEITKNKDQCQDFLIDYKLMEGFLEEILLKTTRKNSAIHLLDSIEEVLIILNKKKKARLIKKIKIELVASEMKSKGYIETDAVINLRQTLYPIIKKSSVEINSLLKDNKYKERWLLTRKLQTFKNLLNNNS